MAAYVKPLYLLSMNVFILCISLGKVASFNTIGNFPREPNLVLADSREGGFYKQAGRAVTLGKRKEFIGNNCWNGSCVRELF